MCGWIMILGWGSIVPDDGYFMYDPRPMSDQRSNKKAIPGNMYIRLNSSLKLLTAKFVVQCCRVLLILYLPDTVMHGISEAGSVGASQWLRREHAANMVITLLTLDDWLSQNVKKRTRNVSSWPD